MAKREMPKKKNEVEEIVTPDVEVAEEVTTPVEEIVEAVEETTTPVEEVIGKVYNCSKLNIRKKPKTDADVVTTVAVGQVLTIDESKSKDDWFKVEFEIPDSKNKLSNNVYEGYCMKKYIKIEK